MDLPDIALPPDSRISLGAALWPAQWLARALLGFPLFAAVFTLAALMWNGEHFSFEDLVDLGGFVAWNLLPPVAQAALILLCARRFPIGLAVTAVGCVVYTAATLSLVLSAVFSDSSTAGFVFVSLPLILLGIVAVFAAAAGLVDATRRPKSRI